MAGFDILNITGSVSKSYRRIPSVQSLSAVLCLLHWQTPFWASGLEKEWATANVESDRNPPFLPLPPLGMTLQFSGSSSAFPSQVPAASTSCICPFGALSSLFIGKNNLLLYMILELISLLLIRTSSSLSLALTCLYSLYSSAMGVRSSFCTFLVGVKADHEDFFNRKPPQQPPSVPQQDLQSSSSPPLLIREQDQNIYTWREKKKKQQKKGQTSCSNKVWDTCVLRLSTIPEFQILLETFPASLKSPALQKSWKTLQEPLECQPI